MEFFMIVILIIAAFAANFFSVMTGGAGLIMTPLMVAFGMPPVNAIAATKFSYLGSSITGTIKFHKEKKIDYKIALPLTLYAVVGAFLAAFLLFLVPPSFLKMFIAFMMLGILALVVFNRNIGVKDKELAESRWRMFFGGLLILVAVVMGTLAGGGLIVLISYVLVLLFGESFMHSAGTQKILNDVIFIILAAIFMVKGVVQYEIAVPLLVSASLGGWFGAVYGLSRSAIWIKNTFMVVIVLLSTKILLTL